MENNTAQRPRKIRITFFIPLLLEESQVGGDLFVINLLKSIDREKFEISLLLGNKKGKFVDEIPKNIRIINLNVSHIRYSVLKLVKYFRAEKPDVFFTFILHANLVSIVSKFLSGSKAKIIISERTTVSRLSEYSAHNIYTKLTARFAFPFLVKIFYPYADEITCVSKGVADDLAKIIGSSAKIKAIYNYFDFEKIIRLSKEKINESWFYLNDLPIICAVGRLVKDKDYPTLLNAFSLVSKQTKSRLIIIGEGRDRKKLETQAQQLNISDSVYFAGFQKNPYKFMAESDIFVLSSAIEGLPNVLVEAMACGTPVISTDCKSGPNEVIEDGENGFLVPVGDEKSLAEAILKLLSSQELREKFSNEGKKVLQKFSLEKTIKEYENIFLTISDKLL